MEPQAANGYVLTLCLLVAAYVRHYDDDDYKKQNAETSMLTPDRSRGEELERKTIARASVTSLARFLLHEIHHPCDAVAGGSAIGRKRQEDVDPMSLAGVFQRLQHALPRAEDVTVIVDEVLQVLAGVDSPDAVSDVVDAIGECVAPLTKTATGESVEPIGDAANALLVRQSVFGVFVRRFVLAANRLLFDGLSRVFDAVTVYRDEYADQEATPRRGGAAAAKCDISLSLTASPTTRFLWKHGDDMDDLPLSPIVGAVDTSANPSRPFALSTSQAHADDSMNDSHGRAAAGENSLSHDQTQYFIHDVVQELERGLTLASSVGTAAVSGAARALQRSTDPNALFVKYLDAVNRREYDAAREALHQYHDIALAHTQRFRQAQRARHKAANANANDPSGSLAASSTSGLHFLGSGVQYAALNLAGLHIAFDRFAAAQDSIQEAIRVAQHHGDHICVAFALAWFVRVQLLQGKPRHQVAALIASALERAEELSLQSLRALVSLTALESDLLMGGLTGSPSPSPSSSHVAAVARFPAPRPLDLWSRLAEIDQILTDLSESVSSAAAVGGGNTGRTLGNLMNMQQQQQQLQQGGGAALTGNARSDGKKTNGVTWKGAVESVLQTMWSLQGKSRGAAAIGWRLYGVRALGSTHDSVFWAQYKDSASVVEIASWISRLVLAEAEWGSFLDDELHPAGDGQSMFARALVLLGDLVRQPELARYELLMREKVLQRTIQHLLGLWSLHRGEFVLADAHIAQLVALSSAASDMPARIEALLLHARLYGETQQYLPCLELLDELDSWCQTRGFELLLAQVLILKSEYLRRSRMPHSPFDALPAVLRAIQICQSHRYDLLLAEAHVVVAEIYLSMGKIDDAVELVDQQMPLVLENGSIQLRAECLLLLAKATLAKLSTPTNTGSNSATHVDTAIEWLDDSGELFNRLENWKKLQEIAFLKTTIWNRDVNKRDEAVQAANEFLHYQQLLTVANHAQRGSLVATGVDTVSMLDRIVQDRSRSKRK